MIAIRGQNQVIRLPLLGDIFPRVINDVVGSKGAHHLDIACAAHSSDFCPQGFGKLYGERSHPARGTINQHPLPWLNLPFIAQPLQRSNCCQRYGCCLLEGNIGWLQHQGIFTRADIFGKTTPTTPGEVPKDLITGPKLRDVAANRFNPPRYSSSRYHRVFWLEKPPNHEADWERFTSHDMPISRVERCRKNLYQDFVILGGRLCYLLELKHIR